MAVQGLFSTSFLGKQKEKDAYWSIVEEMVQNGQLSANNWKGKCLNKFDTVKSLPELKKQYSFLKEVDSIALQKSVENLADSYSRYYKKQNKQPRFKSKRTPSNLIQPSIQTEISQSLKIK